MRHGKRQLNQLKDPGTKGLSTLKVSVVHSIFIFRIGSLLKISCLYLAETLFVIGVGYILLFFLLGLN